MKHEINLARPVTPALMRKVAEQVYDDFEHHKVDDANCLIGCIYAALLKAISDGAVTNAPAVCAEALKLEELR